MNSTLDEIDLPFHVVLPSKILFDFEFDIDTIRLFALLEHSKNVFNEVHISKDYLCYLMESHWNEVELILKNLMLEDVLEYTKIFIDGRQFV